MPEQPQEFYGSARDRTPMPLAEAEVLAAAGNVGRVSLALYAEVVDLRARLDQLESHALEAERTRATGGPRSTT